MKARSAPALVLVALLLVPSAVAAQATGGADAPTDGGTAAPDGRFLGGESGALAAPPAEPPPPTVAPAPLTAPRAAPPAPTRQPGPAQKDDDVEVEVPVPERDPTAPPADEPAAEEEDDTVLGGLASTGFAAAVLALCGLMFGSAGVWLRRASRSSGPSVSS
jgi:hypothetical protein